MKCWRQVLGRMKNRTLLVPDGRLALTALHKGKRLSRQTNVLCPV